MSVHSSTGLFDWLRARLYGRAAVAELDGLSSPELCGVAREVGATTGELRALAGKWPAAADLLARRMSLLHLDGEEVRASEPAVNNDLQKHCSLCDTKSECIKDLDQRSVEPRWRRYCPNAYTLLALRQDKDIRRATPRRSSQLMSGQ